MSKNHSRARSHRFELIELAVLFGTAAVADLLSDLLGHRSEGPGVLACLSVLLVIALFVHRVCVRHNTSPPTLPPRADGAETDQPTGTLWRIRTGVEDTPGRLAVLAGALAAAGANILTMQVHPTDAGATDEFLVRTPPGTSAASLTAALTAAGGGEPWVGPAEVHALVDAPAQALALARRLFAVAAPGGQLPLVLTELLSAAGTEWRECANGKAAVEGIDGRSLYLGVPGRGTLVVTRPDLPFTPAEYARARAMTDLYELADLAVPIMPTVLTVPTKQSVQTARPVRSGQAETAAAAVSGASPSSSSVSEARVAPRV